MPNRSDFRPRLGPIRMNASHARCMCRRMIATCVGLLIVGVASLPHAVAESPAKEPDWKSLFDGRSLKGWKKTAFGGEGDVVVEDARITMRRQPDDRSHLDGRLSEN